MANRGERLEKELVKVFEKSASERKRKGCLISLEVDIAVATYSGRPYAEYLHPMKRNKESERDIFI